MSVIINDFEIVVEGGAETEAKGTAPTERAKPVMTPQDIRDILRRQAERTSRVHAD